MRRASFLAVPVLVALIGSIAAAAPDQPEAHATAVPLRIVQPGAPEQIPLSVTAPPTAEQVLPGYAYPDDGSVVKIGSADAQVVAQPGTSSSAQANTGALAVSLFGGEITVSSARPSRERRRRVGQRLRQRLGVLDHRAHGARAADHAVPEPRRPARRLGHARGARLPGRDDAEGRRARPRRPSPALRVKLIVDHGGLAAGQRDRDRHRSRRALTAAPTTVAPIKPTRADPADAVSTPRDPARRAPRARHVDPGRRAARSSSAPLRP